VGVVPKQSLIDAAKYFLRKQQRSVGLSEPELIKMAVQSLGSSQIAFQLVNIVLTESVITRAE
jgi:glutamate formiminotransferase / formiminotetrahydrofolate cyclodeaminase